MKDLFDRYIVNIDYAQAKRLLGFVEEYLEQRQGTIGDILDMQKIRCQLEDIVMTEETKYV